LKYWAYSKKCHSCKCSNPILERSLRFLHTQQ